MQNGLLAETLKELRKFYGFTQDYVASALGLVRQTYSHYENGKRTPGPDVLFKLAGLYNVSVDDLMQLTVELDRDESYDAPAPTRSSEDLAGFLAYFSDPKVQKMYQYLNSQEKELLYYFGKLPDVEKRELIEIAKLKLSKEGWASQ